MENPSFSEKCYALLRKVPRGKLTTYRELAHALRTKGYRAVGQAMNRNPYAPKVPCHRVVKSDGSLGGYALGVSKKEKLLCAEGIKIKNGRVIDLKRYLEKLVKTRPAKRARR